MKIVLLSVGKTDQDSIAQLIDTYRKRVNFYISFEVEIVPDAKNTKKLSEKEQKIQEGNNLKKILQSSDYVVLLDDKGKQFSSIEFSQFIEKKTHSVPKRLIFIVGGPYGFSEEIYALANEKISLSKMTFTHQMVRFVFVEQLYRAMTILNNELYHHE
ncbi:MAG: 23S rRNA (pseudouridine(1915)-N(3))-methyltransferase RlmH [Dysgonamonadaceae bacterium]|jgi:23S rRNA (pseudouridine1915-N3)-methyltransferase|nr:23S rRNA (pseudouridine(1915)-N(3))-methyltransferase RlmH [Dysgonamonadaceae bacterium]